MSASLGMTGEGEDDWYTPGRLGDGVGQTDWRSAGLRTRLPGRSTHRTAGKLVKFLQTGVDKE